jgi:hypothetical protein
VKPKSANALIEASLRFKQVQPRAMADDQDVKAGQSVFLFASQEAKPSSDVSGLEGIPAHGLFTLLLSACLKDAPNASVKDLYSMVNGTLEKINKMLKDQGGTKSFEQGPNFETSAERAAKPILLPN